MNHHPIESQIRIDHEHLQMQRIEPSSIMEPTRGGSSRRLKKMPSDQPISRKTGGRWNEASDHTENSNQNKVQKIPKRKPSKSVSFALDESGRPLCIVHEIPSQHQDAFLRAQLWWSELELSPKRRKRRDCKLKGLESREGHGGMDSSEHSSTPSLLQVFSSEDEEEEDKDLTNAFLLEPIDSKRTTTIIDLHQKIPDKLFVPSLDDEQHNRLPLPPSYLGTGSSPQGTAIFWTRRAVGLTGRGEDARDSLSRRIVAAYSA